MPDVSGIQLEKNTNGELTHVRIDMKEHGERIMPLLEDLGAVEKTKFQKDWDNALSIDEAFDSIFKTVEENWSKKIGDSEV